MKSITRCGQYIDKFTINLNKKVKQKDYNGIIGRHKELKQMSSILLKRSKNNALLLGEAGVGKTALCEEFAYTIVNKTCDVEFDDVEVLQLDTTGLLAGTNERGAYEQNITELLKELQEEEHKYVLMIDEIHIIVGSVGTGSRKENDSQLNLANLIKPLLARGQLKCIGATTLDEYTKYFESDRALMRRFQPIYLNEPNEEDTLEILKHIRPVYENFHKCKIDDSSLELCVKLASKYLYYRHFPDKAIDIMDESCSMARIRKMSSLNSDIVYEMMSKITNVHIDTQQNQLQRVQNALYTNIFGQNHVLTEIINTLKRVTCEVYSAKRPMASWLFIGPPGTGKTETANIVSDYYFNRSMIRLDMSEYMESFSTSKLLGAPPGYVGYDDGGVLTKAIKKNPYTLILFDEIEKAHTSVHNILLQLLEEGELTDAYGGRYNFRNSIIVMTCNNVSTNTAQLGFVSDTTTIISHDDLTMMFKPELLNRFDQILTFYPIQTNDMYQIVKKIVDYEIDRISKLDKKFHMETQKIQELIHEIVHEVRDVRSIRTALNTKLIDYCALNILSIHGGFKHE